MNAHQFAVGQSVFFFSAFVRGNLQEQTIEKIGRVWVSCTGRRRFDRVSLRDDTQQPIYLSRADFERQNTLMRSWSALRDDFRYHRLPADLTVGDIALVRRLLRLPESAVPLAKVTPHQ